MIKNKTQKSVGFIEDSFHEVEEEAKLVNGYRSSGSGYLWRWEYCLGSSTGEPFGMQEMFSDFIRMIVVGAYIHKFMELYTHNQCRFCSLLCVWYASILKKKERSGPTLQIFPIKIAPWGYSKIKMNALCSSLG